GATCISGRQQFAQHVGQDASMQVVIDFGGRVDTKQHADLLRGSVRTVDDKGDILLRSDTVFDAGDVVGFFSGDSQSINAIFALELQGQNSHSHEVAAVDALETARDDGLDTQQLGTFGRPVA